MCTPLVRPATLDDLAGITAIHNHYVLNTHATFDLLPCIPAQRVGWFHDHSDGKRHRLLVACDESGVLGYAGTGRFRPRDAYDTTVEASIGCRPGATGKGLGQLLYTHLFEALAHEDIHRVVAGVAQPNPASNALHERFGFRQTGVFTEVGRKFGKYWDVRWYERPLHAAGLC